MKKSVKTALIVAAGCIGVGVLLMGAGSAAGGISQLDQVNVGGNDFVETQEKLVRTIEVGDTVKHALHLDAGVESGSEAISGYKVYDGDFSEEIAYEGTLKQLEVEIGVHSVKIEETDGTDIYLEGTNVESVQCYVKNGVLSLKDVGWNKKVSGTVKREIVLTVPADIKWEEADLEANMGNIEAEKLEADQTELSADMGNISLQKLTAGELDISADMGNIVVNNMYTDYLDVSANMGNVDLSGRIGNAAEAEADMGNITLHLDHQNEEFNYQISAEMGTISLDGKDYSGLKKEERLDYGAKKMMELETSMGSIEISFQ